MKLLAFWRRPLFWLAAQLLVVFFALFSTGSLEPEMVADSGSYRDAAEAPSLAAALGGHRTLGYPLFFKLAGLRKDGEVDGRKTRHVNLVTRRLPKIQAAVYLAAVLLFWYAVRVYTGAPWLAFAAALPLVYSGLWSIVRRIQPDFLAAALALASVALLLLVAARPRAKLRWAGLALAVLVTYQVRPAYVFLLVLVPVLGALLWLARRPVRPRRAVLLGLGLLAAMFLPYFLFCAVRWSMAGHFGLVSFGGYNVIGITSSFLEMDLVRELPRGERGLARRILRRRQALEMEPFELHGQGVDWHVQYNSNVWEVAVPETFRTVRVEWQKGGSEEQKSRGATVEVNQRLTDLSRDIILRRPFHYAKWVWDSFVACLDRALDEFWIRWPAILLALSWPLATLLGRGATPRRGGPTADRVVALMLLAVGYFLAHAAVVVLVSVPHPRYVVAMLLLVPSALCAALFQFWSGTVGAARVPGPRRKDDARAAGH